MASLTRGTFLGEGETFFLNRGLRLEVGYSTQKRTLQRLCEWYEQGRLLADAMSVRQLIHSLMASEDVLVRRWSMKALALIGHADDFQRIVARLKVEEDSEAQTWGITALVKNAQGRDLRELRDLADLPDDAAITLAARLYAPDSWVARNTEQPIISLMNAELTLKWATFLIGYDRAPVDLFHPRFSNELFLGELNLHDADDISEYSVWALWERRDFGVGFSRIPLDAVGGRPESVRKWVYRLAAKSPSQAGLDPDALSVLRQDGSPRAREGLALGVAELSPLLFARRVLEWVSIEGDPQVQENLLASMAARGEHPDYAEAVRQRFAAAPVDGPLRRRLLAASEGSPLYGDLRRVHIAAAFERQGLLEYDKPLVVMGDIRVNSPSFQIGGSINAQNFVVGEMINSANGAVQQLERSDAGTAEALKQVLAMLAQSNVEGVEPVAAAVEAVAQAPTVENKRTLLDRLKDYGAKAAAIGTVVGGLDKAVEAVQHLIKAAV